MTTRDFTPRTARWAEDASFVSDPADVVDPTTAKQNVGFLLGEHPDRQTVNWILQHHGVFLDYLQLLQTRFFDGDHLLRNGDPDEGEIVLTNNAPGDWTATMAVDCIGWANDESFLCEADSIAITPTAVSPDSQICTVVATKTGLAVRYGTPAASPVSPTLSAGDVELFEVELDTTVTATSLQTDVRHRGRFRGGLVIAENRLRAGDDGAGGWLLEVDARSATKEVALAGDNINAVSTNLLTLVGSNVDVTGTNTLQIDCTNTLELTGDDVEIDGTTSVEVQGRAVRKSATEHVLNIPGQVLQGVTNLHATGIAVDPKGCRVDQNFLPGDFVGRCALDLPAGSTITSFKAVVTGDGAGSDYTAYIKRQPIADSAASIVSTLSDSGVGDLTQTDTSMGALGTVLAGFGYFIEATVVDTDVNTDDVVFHGFEVKYTGGEI